MKQAIARFGVTETVYYQSSDSGQPIAAVSRFGGPLVTDEQPFVRKFKVGPEWMPLPIGWIKSASQLVLSNDLDPPTVIPTEEERAKADARIIEVAVGSPADFIFACVRPGHSCRFEPVDLADLLVRCPAGETRATVTLIPA